MGEATARKFLDAHESNPQQPTEERMMDQFNNERGIQVAAEFLKSRSFEDTELFDRAKEEIGKGILKILNHEKRQKHH